MARKTKCHHSRESGVLVSKDSIKRNRGRPRKYPSRSSCSHHKTAPPDLEDDKRCSRGTPQPPVSETVKKLRLALVKSSDGPAPVDPSIPVHDPQVKPDPPEHRELQRTRGRTLPVGLLASIRSKARINKRDGLVRNTDNGLVGRAVTPAAPASASVSGKPSKEKERASKSRLKSGDFDQECSPSSPPSRREPKRLRPAAENPKEAEEVDVETSGLAMERRVPDEAIPVELDVVHCVCGLTSRNGLIMQCDCCLTWQHGVCFSVTDPATLPVRYLCQACVNGRRVWASRSYKLAAFRALHEGHLPPLLSTESTDTPKAFLNMASVGHILFRLRDMLHAIDLRVQRILTMASPADEKCGQLAAEAVDAARVQWAMDACERMLRRSEEEVGLKDYDRLADNGDVVLGEDTADISLCLKAPDIVKDLGLVQRLILCSDRPMRCDYHPKPGKERRMEHAEAREVPGLPGGTGSTSCTKKV